MENSNDYTNDFKNINDGIKRYQIFQDKKSRRHRVEISRRDIKWLIYVTANDVFRVKENNEMIRRQQTPPSTNEDRNESMKDRNDRTNDSTTSTTWKREWRN